MKNTIAMITIFLATASAFGETLLNLHLTGTRPFGTIDVRKPVLYNLNNSCEGESCDAVILNVRPDSKVFVRSQMNGAKCSIKKQETSVEESYSRDVYKLSTKGLKLDKSHACLVQFESASGVLKDYIVTIVFYNETTDLQ